MVDTIFADVAQPDQARIVAINAHNFLKNGGHFVISIKVRKFEIQVWSSARLKTVDKKVLKRVFTARDCLSCCLINMLHDRALLSLVPNEINTR